MREVRDVRKEGSNSTGFHFVMYTHLHIDSAYMGEM